MLLTRATTDLRVYERALEDRGIPTYVIGGRGYWAHPQVIDMVAYLEALANPRDEEALFTRAGLAARGRLGRRARGARRRRARIDRRPAIRGRCSASRTARSTRLV